MNILILWLLSVLTWVPVRSRLLSCGELIGVFGWAGSWGIGELFWSWTQSVHVVLLIKNQALETHGCSSLLRSITELLTREWNVEICHIYREANSCADRVAKHGHSCALGFNYFSVLPVFLYLDFSANFMGHHCPCIIAV